MKVLIIDDSDYKLDTLSAFFNKRDATVTIRRSYQSGLKELLQQPHDLVVLDMTMPTFDKTPTEQGHRFRPYAGLEILSEMKRKKILAPTIIVTQFDTFPNGEDLETLKAKLKRDFANLYIGTIYYDASSNDGMADLEQLVRRIEKTK
jgi:CheY-like chemotaxis protein